MNTECKMIPVESSAIKSIGYDNEGSLFIEFKQGTVYEYKNVPKPIYEDFLKSESKGRFFNMNIHSLYNYDYVR